MSKNSKRLLIMLCAVLLMGGLLLLLMQEEDTQLDITEEDLHDHEEAESTLLVDRSTLDLVQVEIKNAGGTYTAAKDSSGEIYIKELSGIPVNRDFVEIAWYAITYISYSNAITLKPEEGQTLAQFGLETPQATVTTLYADGTGNTVRIGSTISSDSTVYYFMLDDDPTVYTSEFDVPFFQNHKYWVSDDMFQTGYDDTADISRIAIEFCETGEKAVIVPHTASDRSDPFCNYDYIFTAPERCAANDYAMSVFIDELSWLTAYEAVEIYPSDEKIAEYGLDKPYAILELIRNGIDHRLTLARHSADVLYALVDDLPVIYQIDTAGGDMLAALSMQALRSTDVHIRYFDAIESLTVSFGGEEYVITTERTAMNGSSELYEYRSYFGGEQIELSNYKALLEIFNQATAAQYGGKPGSDPELTVVIDYFDSFGRGSETITYTENGARRYLCQINGSGTANVSAMWLDKFTAAVQAFAAGETVTP